MPAFGGQMGGPGSRQPSPEPKPSVELVEHADGEEYGRSIVFNAATENQSELRIKKTPFAEGSNGVKVYEATFFKSLAIEVSDDEAEGFSPISSEYSQVSYCVVKIFPADYSWARLQEEAMYEKRLHRVPSQLPQHCFRVADESGQKTKQMFLVSRKSSPTQEKITTLARLLEKDGRQLTFQDRCDILRQVAGQLAVFSHAGVVHGDLHLGNVTLHKMIVTLPRAETEAGVEVKETTVSKWHAAVIDFGESVDVGQEKNKTKEPRYWLPAQILAAGKVNESEKVVCTEQIDLFSFGVLVLELLFKPGVLVLELLFKPGVLQKVFAKRCKNVVTQWGFNSSEPLDLACLGEDDFLDDVPPALRANILAVVLPILNEKQSCLELGFNAQWLGEFFQERVRFAARQENDTTVQLVVEPVNSPSTPVSVSQNSSWWTNLAENLTSLSGMFGAAGGPAFFSAEQVGDCAAKFASGAGVPTPGPDHPE
jgi:hypothetical protein